MDTAMNKFAVIIPAFNEADVIRRKIENSLALDYPADKLQIMVIDDERTLRESCRTFLPCHHTRVVRRATRLCRSRPAVRPNRARDSPRNAPRKAGCRESCTPGLEEGSWESAPLKWSNSPAAHPTPVTTRSRRAFGRLWVISCCCQLAIVRNIQPLTDDLYCPPD